MMLLVRALDVGKGREREDEIMRGVTEWAKKEGAP